MKKLIVGLALVSVVGCSSCGTTYNTGGTLGSIFGEQSRETLAGRAIREVLLSGVLKGIFSLGENNSNELYKLLLPRDVVNVVNTLEQLGLGSLVSNLTSQLNAGAKQAIKVAEPIFTNAIRNITIADAIQLVNGGQNSITNFFREKTSNELLQAFTPIVSQNLKNTEALDTYSKIANTINALPISNNKISTNLSEFVAQQAMNAMFQLIANEEVNIRQNAAARNTDVLRTVFANPGRF